MNIAKISSGKDAPNDINVVIEIPMQSGPVKYEMDKASGAVVVDRFMTTAMYYPCNYGYIPNTLSDDGDPCDVLVVTPFPLISGAVIACRPVAMLKMTDESGIDAKILAVPCDRISVAYTHVKDAEDLSPAFLKTIEHFFQHYKDLESNKWVKTEGWTGVDDAKREIMHSIELYQSKN